MFLKRMVKKLINSTGFDIVRRSSRLEGNLGFNEKPGYEFEAEANEYITIVRHNTMLSKRRLVTLYQ